jgi:putative NADH-flavin reductase
VKLTIFGASSSTGKLLLARAFQAGHTVTALTRDPSKLGNIHEGLNVIWGDALNPKQVEQAIQGNQAVLSLLGPRGKPAVMAAESTRHIVGSMEKYGVKRLVIVSVAGVPVPQDRRGFNVADTLLKLFLRDVFADRQNQLAALESSKLDWVAVRVPRLTDEPAQGSVQAFFGNPSPRMKVTRSDLADFMLKQLTDNQWVRQAPILSN